MQVVVAGGKAPELPALVFQSHELVPEILDDLVADGRRAHDIVHNVRRAIKKGGEIRGPINVNDVVTAVAHMVQPDTAAQSCKIEISLSPELPAIEGDPTQIQQVLINLVHNAVDAMHGTPPGRRARSRRPPPA